MTLLYSIIAVLTGNSGPDPRVPTVPTVDPLTRLEGTGLGGSGP